MPKAKFTACIIAILSFASCSGQHFNATEHSPPLGKQLCTTPGFSIKRVEARPEHGVAWGASRTPYLNADSVTLSNILQVAYNLRPARFDGMNLLPPGNYDIDLPQDPDAKGQDPFPRQQLQKAIQEAFGLTVKLERMEHAVTVMTIPGPGLPHGLTLSAINAKFSAGTRNGGYEVRAGTMEDLRFELEGAIGQPVVDETHLNGKYDYHMADSFRFVDDPEDILGMVKGLGIDLAPATRKIEMLVIRTNR